MNGHGRFFAFRVLLFAFGLLVLVAGFLITRMYVRIDDAVFMFTLVDAMVLYEVLVGPLLVNEQVGLITGGRIVSLMMVLRATVPYAICSLGLMYVANTPAHPPVPLLCVAQLALLFMLGLAVYLSLLTSAHIEAVEASDGRRRAGVDRLRSHASQLAISASRLETQDDRTKRLVSLVGQIKEDVRYLSPSEDRRARGLEDEIDANIEELSSRLGHGLAGPAQVQDASRLADDTLELIARRKALLD